jgi:hypothetical protein
MAPAGGSYSPRIAGLDRKQRVLIIDDWDEVDLNRAGRDAILKLATAQFGCGRALPLGDADVARKDSAGPAIPSQSIFSVNR